MPTGSVTVDVPALLRTLADAGHQELWFQFDRTDADADATEAVVAAVEAANEQLDDAAPGNEESGRFAYCEGPWRVPVNPNEYAIYMKRPGTDDGVVGWLDTFAGQLQAAGLRGRVRPAPTDDSAWDVVSTIDAPQLATFFAYRVTNPTTPPTWGVDDAATAAIAHQVELAEFPGAEVHVRAGRMVRTDARAAAAALPSALNRDSVVSVTFIRRTPPRVVSASFWGNGLAARSLYDQTQSWSDRLAQCIDALVATADLVDIAFVQHTRAMARAWGGLDVGVPPLPGTSGALFLHRRDLLERFVPDARGVQVVTGAHLERANDLSSWRVEPLRDNRYLVQHRDLSAWYGPDGPSDRVVERARADFGSMIADLQSDR